MAHAKARRKTMAEAAKNNSKSRARVSAAFNLYPPDKRDSIVERVALGRDCEPAVLSSYTVRAKTQDAWIQALLRHHKRNKGDKQLRHYLFTLTTDAGFTFEDAPVLAIEKMRRSARNLLKKLKLQGICAFDIDILAKKLPGEYARRVILHVHGVCWTRDRFEPRKVAKKLSAMRCYRNSLGVPGVSFVSRAMSRAAHDPHAAATRALFKHPERDQTARSMAFLALYLNKPPVAAKNRNEADDGTVTVRLDAGHFSLKTALRWNELMSHFPPESVMFSVGSEAALVRVDIRTQLRRCFGHTDASGRFNELRHLGRAWQRFFKTHPKLGFSPTQVK